MNTTLVHLEIAKYIILGDVDNDGGGDGVVVVMVIALVKGWSPLQELEKSPNRDQATF